MSEANAADPMRRRLAELFAAWWEYHGPYSVTTAGLHDAVLRAADPAGKGRQFVASFVARLAGTRIAGFELVADKSGGRWSPARYTLRRTTPPPAPEHQVVL